MVEALLHDEIPSGTFYAGSDLTPEQVAAIRHVELLGSRLAEEQPELLSELARSVELRYLDIAESLIPEELERSPGIAEKAVGFAVRQLLPADELQELTHARRSLRLEKLMAAMGDVAFVEHQKSANRKSWENRERPDVGAMLAGRGRTPWSESEKEVLKALLSDPVYQHQTGSQKGKPDYELIALELNISFHACDAIRYPNSVRSMRNEFYKQNRSS